jgi:hypothetical protein
MRRLVLEWSIKDITKKLKDLENLKDVDNSEVDFSNHEKPLDIQKSLKSLEMLQKMKSLEMLHVLRLDQDGVEVILKVEIKDSSFHIEDLFINEEVGNGAKVKLQLLEQEKDGTCIYFVKFPLSPEANSKRIGLSPFMPVSLRGGKVRVTFLGDDNQVKEAIELAKKIGNFKVVSLMDAKFLHSSPIGRLTGKQRDAIILAFELGYFDTPRKISSEQLATKLGLASSTLAVHLRRAERRLLAEMLNE